MTWITLRMSMTADLMQQLPVDAEGFYTDAMADCVTVVVLWNLNQSVTNYINGRGIHCWGGVNEHHWNALLQGVPNDSRTQVIAVGGTIDDGGDGERGRIVTELRERGYNNILRSILRAPFALIGRDGVVQCSTRPPEGVKATPGCCLIQ